jgi:hypothetical protein
MNESTAGGGGGSVLAPLKALQDILHNRITQKKEEENSKKNLLFFLLLNSIFELDKIYVILTIYEN